jgi:hypothetical protein
MKVLIGLLRRFCMPTTGVYLGLGLVRLNRVTGGVLQINRVLDVVHHDVLLLRAALLPAHRLSFCAFHVIF